MVDSSPKQHSFNFNARSLGDSRNTKYVVRAVCGPLIEILVDETVSIIRHSFTEYFIDPEKDTAEADEYSLPSIVPAISHKDMAISCVNYLTSDWAYDFESEKDKRARLVLAYYLKSPQHTQSTYSSSMQALPSLIMLVKFAKQTKS